MSKGRGRRWSQRIGVPMGLVNLSGRSWDQVLADRRQRSKEYDRHRDHPGVPRPRRRYLDVPEEERMLALSMGAYLELDTQRCYIDTAERHTMPFYRWMPPHPP